MHSAREAVPSESPVLEHLLELAIASSSNARGGGLYRQPARAASTPERIEACFREDTRHLLAGLVDETIVGFAMVRQDSNSRGSVVVVEEIFVEPDAREVGVGEALLDSAEQWASERGAMGIEIEALPGDRKLKNLGERHGFKARTLVMHKKLN